MELSILHRRVKEVFLLWSDLITALDGRCARYYRRTMWTTFRTLILVGNSTGSRHGFEKKNSTVCKSPLAAVWQIDYWCGWANRETTLQILQPRDAGNPGKAVTWILNLCVLRNLHCTSVCCSISFYLIYVSFHCYTISASLDNSLHICCRNTPPL